MLERRTIVDRIEAERDGKVFVQLARQIVDGDAILTSVSHRFPIDPGTAEETIAAQSAWLIGIGEPAPSDDELARVRDQVTLSQTDDVISAFKAAEQAAEEEREAQEAELRRQKIAAEQPAEVE